MSLMPLPLSSISSNARVKEYPTLSVLQVANSSIFRRPGYEAKVRPYDVPPKGGAVDPERSLESSKARARAAIRDIALCNKFDYFFTWTLNKELIDRYDADLVNRKVQTFLKNATYRKGFSYICVPEYHQDGAIHFHGLCNLGGVAIARAINPHTSAPLFADRGQPIYNMIDWKWGFSQCVSIDENYERTCNYVSKYITKDSTKILGKWYFSSRNLVKRPDIELIDGGMDFYSFRDDNPDLPVTPLYQDVCLVSMRISVEEVYAG